MITENMLQEAIAECMGERDPDAATCRKLASYYIIKNELYRKQDEPEVRFNGYSGNEPPMNVESVVDFDSDSEFAKAVRGMDSAKAWALMDELVMTVWATNKPLYRNLMRRLRE